MLAVDRDHESVQSYAGRLTHVVEADTTNEEALRQLGAADFDCAVVAIGTRHRGEHPHHLGPRRPRLPTIWAKAISRAHGRILERVGAHPRRASRARDGRAGRAPRRRRALELHRVRGRLRARRDQAAREYVGKTLGEAGIRKAHGVTVVCIKRRGEDFSYATPDTVLDADDLLIVAGKTDLAEHFAART